MPLSIRYHFTQRFAVSAEKAFKWCTNYDPIDHVLMGDEDAERKITQITEGTIILNDVFQSKSRKIEKQKLVHLYPDKLSWVSTHLTGPNKHSQFLYEISPAGKDASILNFTGHHIEFEEKAGKIDLNSLASTLCMGDENAWKLLAKAMAEELK